MPTDSDSVGADQPTVTPEDGTAAIQETDGNNVARENPREVLDGLRAATEQRHHKVTKLSTDVAQLGEQVAKIRRERETVLDELAKLRSDLAEAAGRVGERTPTDFHLPVEEPREHESAGPEPAGSYAQPGHEQAGSQGPDPAASGQGSDPVARRRLRFRRRR